MGSAEDRANFVGQVRKACRIAAQLRELGVRPYGVVRIDSACGVADWAKDPAGNTKKIAATFREAAKVAADHGERLAAEGEICWGGMHSWKDMLELLEEVDRPQTVGFQADMAHTLLYRARLQRARAPAPAGKPSTGNPTRLDAAYEKLTDALRPGRSISTSPRTTAPSTAPARTTRPAATAWPTTRTASSTSPATPATGCATTTGELTTRDPAHLLGRLHVPQRRDDASRRPGTTSSPP